MKSQTRNARAKPESRDAPADTWGEGRSLLELCEDRSDAEVHALTVERLKLDLECLLEAVAESRAQHETAASDLLAARRLHRVAQKHEDAELAYWTSTEVEHFQRRVPQYAEERRRTWRQWERHWEALFKHRMPDDLYEALLAMAECEGCTLTALMVQLLAAAVAQWQRHRQRRGQAPEGSA